MKNRRQTEALDQQEISETELKRHQLFLKTELKKNFYWIFKLFISLKFLNYQSYFEP